MEYKNNKFKISAPMWNDKFELPDGSYSESMLRFKIILIISSKFLKHWLITHQ